MSKAKNSGLSPWELLYADDLAVIADLIKRLISGRIMWRIGE